MPIAYVILLACFLIIANDPFVSLGAVPSIFVQGMDSFILLSIPLFVLVGVIMNAGGISQRLLDLAVVLVGHMKAGIAHVNIVASMIFSGMSGTTTSDVAGLGRIEIPMMVKEGFRPETAAVVTAVSATIGPIIPPSVPFILYGALTGTSVGKLFMGGVIPGVLLGLWLMAVVAWLAHRGVISSVRYTRGRASFGNIVTAVRRSILGIADAGDPDRRHDHRLVHRDRGRGRRGGLRHLHRSLRLSQRHVARAVCDVLRIGRIRRRDHDHRRRRQRVRLAGHPGRRRRHLPRT